MPAIINSDSGAVTGSAGLKITGNSDGILHIQNNGVTSFVVANNYIKVPVGNTATRPSVAEVGMLRFNNASNVFEAYTNIGWANVSTFVPPALFNIEYLVIGGGGGGGIGGSGFGGGGGGAGGYLTANTLTSNISIRAVTNYTVTIGAGGSSAANGSPSIFSTVTSIGGGRGASVAPAVENGAPGGSGGGAASTSPGQGVGSGGSGISGQGNSGGGGTPYSGDPSLQSGAGGGAGAVGQAASPTASANGGDGLSSSITGSSVTRAGGGGGSTFNRPAGGLGGAGGGGNGGKWPGVGDSGTVNTGGGGGGLNSPSSAGGGGGSGIVILAHSNAYTNAVVSAGLTYTVNTTSRPGFLVYSFTAGTGTVSWN
jgi:hypothetical protein